MEFVRVAGIHSALMIPMYVRERIIGMMYFSSYSRQLKLTRADTANIARFCDQVAGAIQATKLLEQVHQERDKSENLLRNILPDTIAVELKERGYVKPVLHDSVSIMFTDFKGFTSSASRMRPQKLVEELDLIFEQFDSIMEKYKLEKLKTIGDAYMCAGGLPGPNATHPVDIILAAFEIMAIMRSIREIRKSTTGEDFWELRLGIHTGPVVAGVIGKNKFAYDVWGDAVNVASRMESAGEPGRINVSGGTYELVQPFFSGNYRGKKEVKNRGALDMYFIDRIHPELSRDETGLVPNERFQEMYRAMTDTDNVPVGQKP
jgi:class 3 adenylate cyclase